jgi:hypothetical protein
LTLAEASNEADAAQAAGAICQASFLGIGLAAADVAAVWGGGALPATALLVRWAEREARLAARALAAAALLPYGATAPLAHTLISVQVIAGEAAAADIHSPDCVH